MAASTVRDRRSSPSRWVKARSTFTPTTGKLAQAGDRRVPGAEVVDQDAHAQPGDPFQGATGGVEPFHDPGLGDLDEKQLGRDSVAAQRIAQLLGEVGVRRAGPPTGWPPPGSCSPTRIHGGGLAPRPGR